MDQEYQQFCMADPAFYDAMHSEQTAGASFATAGRELPDGWSLHEQDDWFVVDPAVRQQVPMQGWKIHASATVDNADRVLDAVWDYCVPRGISFKFLRSTAALTRPRLQVRPPRLQRQARHDLPRGRHRLRDHPDRAGRAPRRRAEPVHPQRPALAGRPALRPLRRLRQPLHRRRHRRGRAGHRRRHRHARPGPARPGVPRAAVGDAARTSSHRTSPPATRSPPPTCPTRSSGSCTSPTAAASTSATTPAPASRSCSRRAARTPGSTCGATTPCAGSRASTTRCAGSPASPASPRVHDLFWVGEHRFLAMEYVEGDVLGKAIVGRYPLIDPAADAAKYAEFTDWAVDIHRQVADTIEAIHERGVVYGDLHLFNIVVRPDDTIALLDFEVTSPVEEDVRPGLGNPGFAAPRDTRGFDIDRYALACLRLALFLPMTNLLGLHRIKARHFAEIIAEHFPVPREFLDRAVDVIVPPGTPTLPTPRFDAGNWAELRAGARHVDPGQRHPGARRPALPRRPRAVRDRRPRPRLRRRRRALRPRRHRRGPGPRARGLAAAPRPEPARRHPARPLRRAARRRVRPRSPRPPAGRARRDRHLPARRTGRRSAPTSRAACPASA